MLRKAEGQWRDATGAEEYRVLQGRRGRAFGVHGLDPVRLKRLLAQPDGLLWRGFDRPVKIGHTSLIVEAVLPLSGGPVRVAYKQFRPRRGLKFLARCFRRSPARRNWDLARSLLARGIPTPRPLVMCEPRRRDSFRPSYLATEWVDSGENLHLYGWRLAKEPDRLRRAAAVAVGLGRLVGRMHARHISNRDLKAANLLVVDGDRVATYLIDVEGVRLRRRLSAARRAADLSRLAVGLQTHPWTTQTTCRRFLAAYAAEFPPGTIDWKDLWREVAARSRRIVRRKRRRGDVVL